MADDDIDPDDVKVSEADRQKAIYAAKEAASKTWFDKVKDKVQANQYVQKYRQSKQDIAAADYGKTREQKVAERQAVVARYAPGLAKAIQKADAFVAKHEDLPNRVILGPGGSVVAQGLGGASQVGIKYGIMENPVSPVGAYTRYAKDSAAVPILSNRAQFEYDLQKELDSEEARMSGDRQSIDLDAIKVTDEDRARAREAARKALK